jgi:hypothetical protein
MEGRASRQEAIKVARGEDMATRHMRLSIVQRYHINVAGAVAASDLGEVLGGNRKQGLTLAVRRRNLNRW